MIAQISTYVNRYVRFNVEEVALFCDQLEPKTFLKKDLILKKGTVCQHKYFITSGLTRSFYFDDRGKEQIVQFGIENWWITNLESYLCATPSPYSIQAIEKTTVLMLHKDRLEQLFIRLPKLERLFRLIVEKQCVALQRRSDFYMKEDSKQRYDLIVNELPDFVQRVPQYMLASYLDITPEYLSALRANK